MLRESKPGKLLILFGILFLLTNNLSAHCDSIEGPVVKAAKKALETGNINHALIWVSAEDEQEIEIMFDKVNKIRDINEEVRELADMYFYETIVRVHRMGEGVGYTGLKPESFTPEEGIEAADRALESNSVDEILYHVDESNHEKVKEHFTEVQSKRKFDINDLDAGREYVKAYVQFIHFVEALYDKETNAENVYHNH